MLTRSTDWKIQCVHIYFYQITKTWGTGLYNYLRHVDNRWYTGSLSNGKLKVSTHVLLGEESGKTWTCFCGEKSNFIMINEFNYGQIWKICSGLSLLILKDLWNTLLLSVYLSGVFTWNLLQKFSDFLYGFKVSYNIKSKWFSWVFLNICPGFVA